MPATVSHNIAQNCRGPSAVKSFYAKHFGFRRARDIPAGDTQIVFLKSQQVHLACLAWVAGYVTHHTA
jgi:hypothetical protein